MHSQKLLPAAFLAVTTLLCAGPAAQAQTPPPAPRNVKALDFMDTFGVNVHLGDNAYRNTQAVADALNILGWSRVRLACFGCRPSVARAWKDLSTKTAAPPSPAA